MLYAPPAAWSHGYLWGADVVTVPRDATFSPQDQPGPEGEPPARRGRAGYRQRLRSRDRLPDGRADAQRAHRTRASPPTSASSPSRLPPASSCRPAAPSSQPTLRRRCGWRPSGARTTSGSGESARRRCRREPDRGQAADPRPHRSAQPGRLVAPEPRLLARLHVDGRSSTRQPTDPLPATTSSGTPGPIRRAANATARARLQAFFAAGGGYIGAGANGANFLTAGGQVTGLTAATRSGNGRSGIVYWNNEAGDLEPDHRRLAGPGHGDHGPADVVHRDPGDDERRRTLPGGPGRDRRLRLLADRRAVGVGGRARR